jgi:uncharacterized OB-fold protein
MTVPTQQVPWPRPSVGADTAPFWEFASAGELRMQRCGECAQLRWPPGPVCPFCWSPDAAWSPLSGLGVLQSWVTFHREYHPAFPVPYTVGLVELDEGPRLEGMLVDVAPEALRWRAPVHLVWQHRDGFAVPAFILSTDSRDRDGTP